MQIVSDSKFGYLLYIKKDLKSYVHCSPSLHDTFIPLSLCFHDLSMHDNFRTLSLFFHNTSGHDTFMTVP